MIKNRCEPTPRARINALTNASEIWTILAEYKPSGSGILNSTFRKLETLTLASCDNVVSTYADQFNTVLAELNNLSTGLVARFDENYMIYRFHTGLGPQYNQYCELYNQQHDAWQSNGTTSKYKLGYAITRFLNTMSNPTDHQETAMVAHAYSACTQQSVHALVSTANASAKLEHRIQDGCNASNSRTYTQTCKVCSNCNRDWHERSECREFQERNSNSKRPSDESGHHPNQNRSGRGNRGGRGGGGAGRGNKRQRGNDSHGNKSNDAGPKLNVASMAFNLGAAAITTMQKLVSTDKDPLVLLSTAAALTTLWILNTGCTQYVTRDRSVFVSYTPFPDQSNVVTGLKGACTAVGYGRVCLESRDRFGNKCSLLIDNVWYVPSIGFNLISFGQLEDDDCPINIFPKHGFEVGQYGAFFRRQPNRLYILDTWQATPLSLAAVNTNFELADKITALSRGTSALQISEELPSKIAEDRTEDRTEESPSEETEPSAQSPSWEPSRKPKYKPINEDTLKVWHARHGHLGRRNLIKLVQMSDGMDLTAEPPEDACEPCTVGNMQVQPHTGHMEPGRALNDLIHSDIQGPFVVSFDGMVYLLTFLCDWSLRSVVVPIPNKSASTVVNAFKTFVNSVEHGECRVTRLRSDCGTEYDNDLMLHYRQSKGITWEATVPYNPQMNGKAERLGQTIQKTTNAMLKESGLSETYWSELCKTANYLRNRQPVTGRDVTPFQGFSGYRPKLSHLRIIGQWGLCQVRKGPQQGWKKHQDRAVKRQLLGYVNDYAYRMLDPATKRVATYNNVAWIDQRKVADGTDPDRNTISNQDTDKCSTTQSIQPHQAPKPPPTQSKLIKIVVPAPKRNTNQVPPPAKRVRAASPDNVILADDLLNSISNKPSGQSPPTATIESSQSAQNQNSPVARASIEPSQPHRPLTRSHNPTESTPSQQPRPHEIQRTHPELSPDPFAFLSKAANYEALEPRTYKEAMADEYDKMYWQLAMEEEFDSLATNDTWKLTNLPPNHRALGGKWVFKHKRGPDGSIIRYKARWVVRGFEQREGIDFNETFASVVKPMSYKAIFALAAALDWELEQMDVKTAFLYGHVEEDVYVTQPEGFKDPKHPNKVCKLVKALYGLKQSPRVWYNTISAFLKTLGFEALLNDLSVFTNGSLILALYVDDILLAGPNKAKIQEVKDQLSNKFHMTDLGTCAYYLGMTVTRDRPNRTIRLGQAGYVEKFLKDHGMWECKQAAVPMNPGEKMLPADDDYQAPATFRLDYQSAVGSLMYAMLGTRPDIAFPVSVVSRYGSNPDATHWKAVQRICRYLRGTVNQVLVFKGTLQPLTGYTDADWAGDHHTRRSTSGYIFNVGSGAISWQSKRQPTVALSTCEAEYIGQTQATKEAIWLRNLLQELNPDSHWAQMVVLYGDNQGAIALSKNPENHARTKHMAIQTAFVREQVAEGNISIEYTPTEQQMADGLTKALPKDKFIAFRSALGLESLT